MEDEHLKVMADCANKLVALSQRNERDEKEKKTERITAEKKKRSNKERLETATKEKHVIADRKVISLFYKFRR